MKPWQPLSMKVDKILQIISKAHAFQGGLAFQGSNSGVDRYVRSAECDFFDITAPE